MPFRTRDSVLSCYHVLLGDFLQVPRISNNHCSCIESTYGVRWVFFFPIQNFKDVGIPCVSHCFTVFFVWCSLACSPISKSVSSSG